MSSGKTVALSKYAQHKYGIAAQSLVDFEVGVNCGCALLAIAGADGQLAEAEFQWYIDEQEMVAVDSEAFQEYIEILRKFDWKNANLEELLSQIKFNFPLNFRNSLLYQAIKMSRADGFYHEKEKAAVAKAAEILGVDSNVVVSLESVAEMEDTADRLRIALFETKA
ncbi:MAG: hypothetical protein F6K54_32395 [Okeania sp. SIO3B5]|uniref:TerB family tellurite resistance protein n=1 Tax=Okeania sp. SIO3B5 TaxID=2607811 RepID=UPI0013FE5E55|nr:TerB family tellurite resistance protein [Okeania sp. SIO3B5]NEO57364.1 hypothetical protein [Okeania sp. SIO3B5]